MFTPSSLSTSPSFSVDTNTVIDLVESDEDDADRTSNDADPFHITSTSQHVFPTYQTLREYLDQYGVRHGFEVRYPSNTGVPNAKGHYGAARCWCWLGPPTVLKPEEQQHPSHPPQRTVVPRTANRSGNQIKCGCSWCIHFNRRVNGDYVFTTARQLNHTGHECVAAYKLEVTIDSFRVVPDEVLEDVRIAVRSGWHGVESLRRFVADRRNLELNRSTFSALVQRTKAEYGIKDGEADFRELGIWLQQQMRDSTAIARINIENAVDVSGIYYMSVPSFSSTVLVPLRNMPAREARWGQMTGWGNTIASIAAENSNLYGYLARKMEELCREAEQLASKPEPVSGTSVHLSSVIASAPSALHPTVSLEQMQMPQHRKHKRGNPSERRQQSAAEVASKRLNVPLTASQAM